MSLIIEVLLNRMMQFLPGPIGTVKFHLGFNDENVVSRDFEGSLCHVDIWYKCPDDSLLSVYNKTLPLLPIISVETENVLDRTQSMYILQVDGSLQLEVEVSIERLSRLKDDELVVADGLENLSDDLEQAFDDGVLKDVKFIIGTKMIHAHKVVLAARSKVFKKMFIESTKDAGSTLFSISDVSYDVFAVLIRFIYTGKPPQDLLEIVFDLIAAADKYQVEDLMRICEREISTKLTEDNAETVLSAVERYGLDESIKKEAFQMVKK